MCNYVVLDLEMCHIHHEQYNEDWLNNEIIQIGAVLLNEKYEIVNSFMTYVSPQYGHVDTFINKLTGISDENLKDAPRLKEALDSFFHWMPKDSILVSWSENDEYQITKELNDKNISIPNCEQYLSKWEDCQELFNSKVDTSKNYKLSEALRISDIDFESSEHDALVDAKNTAKLFKKLMIEKDFKFNNYYISSNEVKRSLYNPFADLLANYCFE